MEVLTNLVSRLLQRQRPLHLFCRHAYHFSL
uniref:Uncharacterized protein n=1 Tax=Podoviridae sp. ctxkP1 TaxID=2826591 RepID=A0A8S5QSU6_9CAUD|nr:MAG TPA: hypothetical protein [Podoviridae sp. ctxkP1]